MVISDLNHLEVVAEASNVVGGGYDKKDDKNGGMMKGKVKFPKFVFVFPILVNKQSNTATINQTQNVKAVAISGKGDATAIAVGGDQSASVEQSNVALAAF